VVSDRGYSQLRCTSAVSSAVTASTNLRDSLRQNKALTTEFDADVERFRRACYRFLRSLRTNVPELAK
jgi:hypothetical protein